MNLLKSLINSQLAFMGVSCEKTQANPTQLLNLAQSVVVLENPTNWDLETAVCPIFAKLFSDIFHSLFTGSWDKFVP